VSVATWKTLTSSEARGYSSGRSRTAFTTVKIALLTPIARPRTASTTIVKSGFLT